jgi:hypothetical protein
MFGPFALLSLDISPVNLVFKDLFILLHEVRVIKPFTDRLQELIIGPFG